MAGTLTNGFYHDWGSVTAKPQLGQLYTEPGPTFPAAKFIYRRTSPQQRSQSEHSPEMGGDRHMVIVEFGLAV